MQDLVMLRSIRLAVLLDDDLGQQRILKPIAPIVQDAYTYIRFSQKSSQIIV